MKKLFLLTIMFITLMISCNENEIIDPPAENQSVLRKKNSKKEVSLTQKAAATFNEMLLTKGVKESLSTIIQDDIMMLEGVSLRYSVFEDHFIMLTDYVFEDHLIMLTNSTIKEADFSFPNESIFGDDIIVLSSYIFEDNIAMLSKDIVIEDNIIMKASIIKDDVLPEFIDSGNKITFEDLFNTTFKKLYPEDRTSLNSILEKYPKLFFSINSSLIKNFNPPASSKTNVVVMSTQTCSNGSNNTNNVKLTLIDNTTGNSLLPDYYFRNNISSIKLKNSSGVTKACYNAHASTATGTLTFNPTNDFLIYNDTNPIPNGTHYYLEFNFSSTHIPFYNISTYFGINTTASIQLNAFLHNTDKSNLDFSLTKSSDYYTHSNSNFNHYITTHFLPNEKITFNPILSTGLKTYSLKLTEVRTGIQETVSNLNNSIDGFVVDLKSTFSMHIGLNGSTPIQPNEYTLEMIANDCSGNTHSKTISFLISNNVSIDPVRF